MGKSADEFPQWEIDRFFEWARFDNAGAEVRVELRRLIAKAMEQARAEEWERLMRKIMEGSYHDFQADVRRHAEAIRSQEKE